MYDIRTLSAEDLGRSEIREAAAEHRVILLTDTNGEEDKVMVRKAIKTIKACWSYVRPGLDLNWVHLYVNGVLESNPVEFRIAMSRERKYAKYLSQIVGALLKHGVFKCSAKDLARCVAKAVGRDVPTVEQYLYQGMKKKSLLEIFIRVDKKVTKS